MAMEGSSKGILPSKISVELTAALQQSPSFVGGQQAFNYSEILVIGYAKHISLVL